MRYNMKNIRNFIIACFVLATAMLLGCVNPTDDPNNPGTIKVKTALDVPTNIVVNLDSTPKVTFNRVENATDYEIFVYNSENAVIQNQKFYSTTSIVSYTLDTLSVGTYAVSIKALAGQNAELYLDSEISDKVSFEIKKTIEELSKYYQSTENLVGAALKSELRSIITSTHKKITSYEDCKDHLQIADIDPNNPNNLILFYTGVSAKAKWDGGNTWNREHVWAQSLSWFKTSGAGSDLHHIRPCNPSVNTSRGNKKFGTSSGYYEPNNDYKGDVARIIFYLFVRYPQSDSYSFNSIAQSLDMLLAWNELDQVSSLEITRNNYIYTIQGNRNPFIDYPQFANQIWK